ncbi:hypothetical protein JCM11491_001790 [Sporobolomyces phaffii]
MFNSPLPNSLSASPSSTASHSLEPPPARYQSHSPSFQVVPLAPPLHPAAYPLSGSTPLSPTSPSGRVGIPLPHPLPPTLPTHRASISSSSNADASSSKGSPASPLVVPSPSALSQTAAAPPPAPAPKPTKAPYVPPPPPPPLSNPVELLERSRHGLTQLIGFGNVDARPSRQAESGPSIKSGACQACRLSKSKCSQGQPSCDKCRANNLDCVYTIFAKRGRKRTMTPNQALLQNCHRDIEQALAILAANTHPQPVPPPLPPLNSHQPPTQNSQLLTPHLPTRLFPSPNEEEESGSTKELKDVLENPLALLAHISSLKVGGDSTTDEESGKHFLPQQTSRDAEPTVEGYFATGLYQLRSDADPAYDPVSLGIITEQTLARFVEFYFSSLHPFVFHLTPSIHTPRFLRDTSPFLTTALACLCATFDPSSQSTVPALFNHLQLINTRIWSEGLKSLEIVQAYMLLIHWTPIANNWGDDRRWGWLGTAIRIATEIKLHKTLNQTTYDFYRSVTPLSDDAFQRLSDDRIRSWRLISVCETALGVSTGRLGAISNLCSVWPGPPTPLNLTRDHPHYNTYAILELTKIYANGICLSNNVTDVEASTNFDIRASFKSKWMHDLQQWRQTWVHANHYVRMVFSHNLTILLSISLRFRGPVAPVLEECRVQAYETATLAVRWPDDSYKWGSNISVVVVAYAATLLLRIDATKPGPLSPHVIQLCAAVADKLLQTGATRPQTRTLATLHGTRIRTLLAASTAPSGPQPLPSSLLPSDLTSQPSLTHPDIHATFESLSSASAAHPQQLFPPVFPGTGGFDSGPNPEFSLHFPPPAASAAASTLMQADRDDDGGNDDDDGARGGADGQEDPMSSSASMSMSMTNGIGLRPDSDHLWSLPASESHMLWDLFHDHRPDPVVVPGEGGGGGQGGNADDPTTTTTTGGGTSSGNNSSSGGSSTSTTRGRRAAGAGAGAGRVASSRGGGGGRGKKKTGDPGADGAAVAAAADPPSPERDELGETTTAAEDWVHRNALETDWLNSEPGAWAW